MNFNRSFIAVVFALVVGLLLSLFVYRAFQQASTHKEQIPQQQIVVASMALEVGTRLTTEDVQMIPWPGSTSVAGMMTRIEDAVGRAVISPLVPNEMILESKLAPKEGGAGLQATIPEGMRAVSVAVNDVVGVAGFVVPGSSVDVLVTGQIPGATQTGALNATRTILENVRVLAAGQKIGQDHDGKPQTVPVVTLLVSPKDAATLTMASTEGRIQLSLRNTIDSKSPAPEPVLQSAVFGSAAPPPVVKSASPVHRTFQLPVVAAPSPFTVEIILGDKRETKSFPNQ
ncbi:MAG TPA: Flp pilus assembly protein CpaB [Candidatus Acidoferrales bacterium]|nr:Flp pilus assembly protein CpaB [Candidatus Acidoferrales bacterium]